MPSLVVNDHCFKHFGPSNGVSEFLTSSADAASALVALVESVWKPEYDGRTEDFLIRVDAETIGRFGTILCAMVELTSQTRLVASYATRPRAIEGELPFLNARALDGRKVPAACADIVIYPEALLGEDERRTVVNGATVPVAADFHVVTILAYDRDGQAVTPPVTMARNYFALVGQTPEGIGGTGKERESDPESFLRSLLYWRNQVMCAPSNLGVMQPGTMAILTEATAGVCDVDDDVTFEAVFEPVLEGSSLPFVQFRATNRDDLNEVMGSQERMATPAELALAHAAYLRLPEGEGVQPYLPTAQQYAESIFFYATHVQLPSFDRTLSLPS